MKINQETLTNNQQALLLKLGQKNILSENSTNINNNQFLPQSNQNIKNSTVGDALKNLFTELFEKQTSNRVLLNFSKNTQIFKTFENFGNEIKKMIELIEVKNQNPQNTLLLKSLLIDIEKIDTKSLQSSIEKTILSSNTKNILLLVGEQDDLEIKNLALKLISQIEYFQLNSYLNNSIYTHLPFDWSEFEDGDIEFKKEDQKQYTCHIKLTLKDFGVLKINIFYDNENHISLGFFTQNEILKDKISTNLPTLRKNLKESAILIQHISLIDKLDENTGAKLSQFDDKFNNQTTCVEVIV